MKKLMFKTTLSSLKKGGKSCYRAQVCNTGTLRKAEIIRNAAQRVGANEAAVGFGVDLFIDQVGIELCNGHRLEVENFFSSGLVVQGTFPGATSPWDKSENTLAAYFAPKGNLKASLAEQVAENVTVGVRAQLLRVLDVVSKTEGVITNQPNITVYLSGKNFFVNALAEDEGVWIEDDDGTIVAKATVTSSTGTTVDCVFDSLPEDGEYKIVVATRGGLGSEFGVSIARKNVTVKTAND